MSITPELLRYINASNHKLTHGSLTPTNLNFLKRGGLKVLSVCWHGLHKSQILSRQLTSINIGSMYLVDGFCKLVEINDHGLLESSQLLNALNQFDVLALIMSDFTADTASNTRTSRHFQNLIRYPNEDIAYQELIGLINLQNRSNT